jgi:ATP-binding cassette subfamily F protein uup
LPLLRLDNAFLHYGNLALLDGVSLTLRKGEKIGLLGRNGAGKTTLLRVLEGEVQPDSGERWLRPGIRMAWLQQTLPAADGQTVYDLVAGGLAEAGKLLAEYHHLLHDGDHPDMRALARVQQKIEDCDGWQMQQKVETTISQLGLPGETNMSELSGGWRRRAALARALVSDPDIMLLDEPTNHLDIPAIEWLEEQLRNFNGALVLITHDRRFLQNVANIMAELDRGRLTTWQGDYQGFLCHREAELAAEERANELFDKKLAREETWIRQGIKARRTRNEGRVRALKALRDERSQRRERAGTAGFAVEDASRSGKIVAEIEHIGHSFDGNLVIDDFSTIIQRGDRIGIVGANGAGKSTLVKILLGKLDPERGSVKLGTRLEIAYSDQLRDQLDPDKNLIDNVCGGQEFIELDGRRRHAISYLGEFLFNADRTRMPVSALSGGEQNRAVLAQLFSKPANLLVLDEPTNDLDIETLELLEEILLAFEGTVILVSHDREFMDNVVTSIIAMDGAGRVEEFIGAYTDWEAKTGGIADGISEPGESNVKPDVRQAQSPGKAPPKRKTKKSHKVQRELGQLMAQIEKLEQRQDQLEREMAEPGFFDRDYTMVNKATLELAELNAKLGKAFARWDELEAAV